MNLREILDRVRDEGLSKTELQHFEIALATLYEKYQYKQADLEKKEAIFLESMEGSEASRIRRWKATDDGKLLIDIDHQIPVINKWYGSVKSRLIQMY